jgi:hypothetical protein
VKNSLRSEAKVQAVLKVIMQAFSDLRRTARVHAGGQQCATLRSYGEWENTSALYRMMMTNEALCRWQMRTMQEWQIGLKKTETPWLKKRLSVF